MVAETKYYEAPPPETEEEKAAKEERRKEREEERERRKEEGCVKLSVRQSESPARINQPRCCFLHLCGGSSSNPCVVWTGGVRKVELGATTTRNATTVARWGTLLETAPSHRSLASRRRTMTARRATRATRSPATTMMQRLIAKKRQNVQQNARDGRKSARSAAAFAAAAAAAACIRMLHAFVPIPSTRLARSVCAAGTHCGYVSSKPSAGRTRQATVREPGGRACPGGRGARDFRQGGARSLLNTPPLADQPCAPVAYS